MIRWFFLLLLGLVVYLLLRRPSKPPPSLKPPEAASGDEPMCRCAECGVHFPRIEAVVVAGRTYCCDEHAQRGPHA